MCFKLHQIVLGLCTLPVVVVLSATTTEKVTFISVERPAITFLDPRWVTNANFTTKRYGRRNPVYYVNLEWVQHVTLTNKNAKFDFYFYEFLTNRYHRSFVEMHYRACDLIHKDPFFGAAMRQGKLANPCPYPPGDYHLYNMTVNPEVIPRGFPFRKGRIYANLTYNKEPMAGGHIDMEIKEMKIEKKLFEKV